MRNQRTATGPTSAERRTVMERAVYSCEVCGTELHDGTAWIQPHSIHHRRPRAMGGTRRAESNDPTNLLLVCGTGTTGCHGRIEANRAEAHAAGWLVHQQADPAAVPVRVWCRLDPVLLTPAGQYHDQENP
jgi:hypothetical protein